ncbi:hypothetical protein BSL78_00593 [Apostichopus japonicus]|uniref:Protein FAM177A1 n=2 Tax=Stichopus japonicus TaxID=307972 RepID=A0A2G8LQF2_STIJA|nr:hypothetical protein BSL78_00593 [Apostichopus japonicus]
MASGLPDDSGAAKVVSPGNVSLENTELGRKPRRILHFSDGVMEEYSTDEEDGENEESAGPVVDPQTLTWGPFLWYYTYSAALKTFNACEIMGEKLAYFFGITSPKYQYAINEFHRLEEEEKEQLKKQEEDRDRIRDEKAMKEAAKQNSDRASAMKIP